MLRIRLRRTGAKKQPHYRVVVAEARTRRDGAFVENLGYYDPLTEPATVVIDAEKAKDWMAKGASPSDTVVRLFRKAGILAAQSRGSEDATPSSQGSGEAMPSSQGSEDAIPGPQGSEDANPSRVS